MPMSESGQFLPIPHVRAWSGPPLIASRIADLAGPDPCRNLGAETFRAQFPTLGIVGDTAVTSISRRRI